MQEFKYCFYQPVYRKICIILKQKKLIETKYNSLIHSVRQVQLHTFKILMKLLVFILFNLSSNINDSINNMFR
jgi:hypothetical protein